MSGKIVQSHISNAFIYFCRNGGKNNKKLSFFFFVLSERQFSLLPLVLPLIFKNRSLDIRHFVIVWNIKCVVRKSTGSS